jgi:hypothetical protein
MIGADPGTRVSRIWQHLADDHGVTVTYGALRAYVVSRRTAANHSLASSSGASVDSGPVRLQ